MSKEYVIPISWMSYKNYTVEADNLQDAIQDAYNIFMGEPDDYYLQDSWDIDSSIDEDYPDEEYDINKIK